MLYGWHGLPSCILLYYYFLGLFVDLDDVNAFWEVVDVEGAVGCFFVDDLPASVVDWYAAAAVEFDTDAFFGVVDWEDRGSDGWSGSWLLWCVGVDFCSVWDIAVAVNYFDIPYFAFVAVVEFECVEFGGVGDA